MDSTTVARGVAAGLGAAVAQVVVGKVAELALMPEWENADYAPRLVHRLGRMVGVRVTEEEKWVLGTAFHFAYGAGWGGLYAVARERVAVPWPVGGALLGGLIWSITFPRHGLAVLTDAERPPEQRTEGADVVAVSVALAFGLATAYLYQRWSRE